MKVYKIGMCWLFFKWYYFNFYRNRGIFINKKIKYVQLSDYVKLLFGNKVKKI